MKKKRLLLCLMVLFAVFGLVACGKQKVGDQELLKQIKNGSYEKDEKLVNSNGWVINMTRISNVDESILELTKSIENLKCKNYLGYKVEDNKITYVFTGIQNADNVTKAIAYVTQDADSKLEVSYADYSDLDNIYADESNVEAVSDNNIKDIR